MLQNALAHNITPDISVNQDMGFTYDFIDESLGGPPGEVSHNLKERKEKLATYIRPAKRIPGGESIIRLLYDATVLDEIHENDWINKYNISQNENAELKSIIKDKDNEIERLKAGPDFAEVERQKKELEAKELKMIQEAEVAGKQSTKLIYFTDGKKVEKEVTQTLMCVALFYKEASHVDHNTDDGRKFIIDQISIQTGLEVRYIKEYLKRVFGKNYESYPNPKLKIGKNILDEYLKANGIPMILTSSAVNETA